MHIVNFVALYGFHTAITCAAPVALAHGSVIYETALWGSDVIYRCDNGYQFDNGSQEMRATCLTTRQWNRQPSECEGEAVPNSLAIHVVYRGRHRLRYPI